jgi:hypothetical protein
MGNPLESMFNSAIQAEIYGGAIKQQPAIALTALSLRQP